VTAIWQLSATETAARVREGSLRPSECLDVYLDRIRCSDLNAVVTLSPRAHEDAGAADRVVGSGRPLGPLHGVPFTVKDTIDTEGLRTTAGSKVLADRVPARSATSVHRLQAAGGVLVGKANCSEFAVDTHTDNPLFGTTRNPQDLARTAGGSSGGDAAATAGGLTSFGLGTDFGGSLRWPAHCTGTVTLRATPGVLPEDGIVPFSAVAEPPAPDLLLRRLMTVGPLTRSVADAHLLFEVLAARPHEALPAIDTLAIAWCDGEGTVPVSRAVRAAVEAAAHGLAASVASVTQARPPRLEECASLFASIRDGQGLPQVQQLVEARSSLLGEGLAAYLAGLAPPSPSALAADEERLAGIRRGVLRFFEDHPVLLMPVASVTAPVPAPHVDVDGAAVPWTQLGSSCRAITVLGLPVAVVTCGRDDAGLPVGVQVVGRPHQEHEVLAVASAIERCTTEKGRAR
jgi:Asp-tRNA(Asn)/Glu-tRNA(Gln) amidotransferase A subunit family amidase